MIEFIIGMGLGYVAADIVFGMVLGRCVMPGLRCRACKHKRGH